MQESIAFLVRVQCRRKESSRSLYHLLMSFLLEVVINSFTNIALHLSLYDRDIFFCFCFCLVPCIVVFVILQIAFKQTDERMNK